MRHFVSKCVLRISVYFARRITIQSIAGVSWRDHAFYSAIMHIWAPRLCVAVVSRVMRPGVVGCISSGLACGCQLPRERFGWLGAVRLAS